MESLIRYSLTQFLPFLSSAIAFRRLALSMFSLVMGDSNRLASILYVLIPNVELLVRFADNFRCTGVLYNPGMGIPTTSVKHYSGCSACESAALYIYPVRQ